MDAPADSHKETTRRSMVSILSFCLCLSLRLLDDDNFIFPVSEFADGESWGYLKYYELALLVSPLALMWLHHSSQTVACVCRKKTAI